MPFSHPTWTVLELDGIGVVPYSIRKANQTLTPIRQAGANMRRDVNGTLRSVGGDQFKKYASVITCTDIKPFAADDVWPGKEVTVSCIAELNYPVGGSPTRPVVPGSEVEEEGFVTYNPILVMKVVTFQLQKDEYGAETGWSLTLEEV